MPEAVVDDELEHIERVLAREDAEAARTHDPDADDGDEEDPIGSGIEP